MHIHLLSKLHVSDSNVVCSEGDADLHRVGPDVSTDAVLQRLVYNCYKRKTNLIGLNLREISPGSHSYAIMARKARTVLVLPLFSL